MISPTAHAFWSHWRDEHQHWKIIESGEIFIATDAGRRLSASNMDFSSPIDATASFTKEVCRTKTEAHTYIALRCTQHALEQMGLA